MATEDDLQPDRSPIFLIKYAEEIEPPDIGTAWDVAAIASLILRTSIVAATVTAIGIAVLSIENPVALVASVTDLWVDKPALQPDADPSTSTIQSIADTQDLPPTTTDAPARDQIAAAVEPADQSAAAVEPPARSAAAVEPSDRSATAAEPSDRSATAAEPSDRSVTAVEPADQSQAGVGQPVTEALFKQFQAWAAEEGAQAGPAQPVQAAPVRAVQAAPAQARPTKKPRRDRTVQNARAEIHPQRNQRARIRQDQDGQVPPVADPRAQDPSGQNAQPPSLLQSLGLRN